MLNSIRSVSGSNIETPLNQSPIDNIKKAKVTLHETNISIRDNKDLSVISKTPFEPSIMKFQTNNKPISDPKTPQAPIISAYFSKIQSSFDKNNNGLSGQGKLPIIKFDQDRFTPLVIDEKTGLPKGREALDAPSFYIGGNSKKGKSDKELDCGLSWDKVYDKNGKLTYTIFPNGTDSNNPEMRFSPIMKNEKVVGWKDGNDNLVTGLNPDKPNEKPKRSGTLEEFTKKLQPNYAFRPFWRTTNSVSEQLKIPEERNEYKYDPKTNGIKVGDKFYPLKPNKDNKGATIPNQFYYETPVKNKDGTDKKNEKGIVETVKTVVYKEGELYVTPKPTWHNESPNNKNNIYFYPGQKANFDIEVDKGGRATLKISGENGTFSKNFNVVGFNGSSDKSFKIVNSIDQFTLDKENKKVGLEGQKSGVLPTKTTAIDGEWGNVKIKKVTGDDVPLDKSKPIIIRGNDTLGEDFELEKSPEGVLNIDITPDVKNHTIIREAVGKAKEIFHPKLLNNKFKEDLYQKFSKLNNLMQSEEKKQDQITQRNKIIEEIKNILSKEKSNILKNLNPESQDALLSEMFIYLREKSSPKAK
jgi:hypothetical protein